MNKKVKTFFSDKSTRKTIDILILIVATISFFLIVGKGLYSNFFDGVYPINIDWVVVGMMSIIIFLYGLKMLGGKSAGAGFQLILIAIIIIALAIIIGIVRKAFIT